MPEFSKKIQKEVDTAIEFINSTQPVQLTPMQFTQLSISEEGENWFRHTITVEEFRKRRKVVSIPYDEMSPRAFARFVKNPKYIYIFRNVRGMEFRMTDTELRNADVRSETVSANASLVYFHTKIVPHEFTLTRDGFLKIGCTRMTLTDWEGEPGIEFIREQFGRRWALRHQMLRAVLPALRALLLRANGSPDASPVDPVAIFRRAFPEIQKKKRN